MFWGINHAFLTMALRGMAFCLLFVVLGAGVIVLCEWIIRRGLVSPRRPLWAMRLFQVAFLLFFVLGGSFGIYRIHRQFQAASRVMATCPPLPAWVTTYAVKHYTTTDDHGHRRYVYVLYADIAPQQKANFPIRRKMEIEKGVNSSFYPSSLIMQHASGKVYLSADRRDPTVIAVAGKYLCAN